MCPPGAPRTVQVGRVSDAMAILVSSLPCSFFDKQDEEEWRELVTSRVSQTQETIQVGK